MGCGRWWLRRALGTGGLFVLAALLAAAYTVAATAACARAESLAGASRPGLLATALPRNAASGIVADSLPAVTIAISANATQGLPVTITVEGEAEAASKLFVYVSAGGVCEPEPELTAGGAQALSAGGGEQLGEGAFEKAYEYLPASVGSYTVCAYVDETEAGVPSALGEAAFEALYPTDVSIQVSANPIRGEPVTITVSGETGVTRKLFVYISSAGIECEPDPVDSGGEALSAGETLSAGGFDKHYKYTPEFIAKFTICAFVDETEAAAPSATAVASFTSSPSRAEVEERAAEIKAQEERAKAQHEAEVAAGEAAATAAGEAAMGAQQATARATREAAARAAQEAAATAARQAAEQAAAQAAAAAAQAAKLKAARAKPVTRLAVSAVAHAGPTLAHPGYTSLAVTTSPFAFVTVTLARDGSKTLHREWGEQPSAIAASVAWSCQHPGGTYRYTVTAWTGVGRKLTRTGRFAPISAARCRVLARQESDTGKRQQAQARIRAAREYEEEIERRAHAAHEQQEREEAVCREAGGTPTIVIGAEGATWVCEGPGGVTLPTA
jgi:pyruvate/2-oxoglutarate dehydrogenase complex dihydrolipoamide acyltransferase (E2) component